MSQDQGGLEPSIRKIMPTGGIVVDPADKVDPEDVDAARPDAPGTEAQFRILVEGMPQLVWRSCDMGNWTWASPQWLAFTDQTQEESHGRGWLAAVHPDDHAATMEAWAEARSHGLLDVEFRVLEAATQEYVWHRTRSAPASDTEGRIIEWLGTTTNIHDLKLLQFRQAELLAQIERHVRDLETEIQVRKRTEDRLLYTSFHDELTKLHNRAFFMGQLRRALTTPVYLQGRFVAAFVLDLDRFKSVNDSLGHGTGDTLLTILANRLKRCLEPDDTLARIGGDEFGILVDRPKPIDLPQLAESILTVVQRPISLGRRQIVSSCSLGATWLTPAHLTPEDALREADTAMYLAKRAGSGQFLLFEPGMLADVAETLDLRSDLAHAVSRSELELHYQPIWDTQSDLLVGFEALVRWCNPRLGILQPGSFIPLAEESGMICDIGRWVLRYACEQFGRWRDQYPGLTLSLSVNVCSEELKDSAYVQNVRTTLLATGIEPVHLELEITESIYLEHSKVVFERLAELRDLGVRIAIDDFGTGYSSLTYLERFEVDTVKIDRSFVTKMLTEVRTKLVVEAILMLARALSLRVIAEGIEGEEQLGLLVDMRCDAVQGYHLGRPAPAKDLGPFLDGYFRGQRRLGLRDDRARGSEP